MNLDDALAHIRSNGLGTLATLLPDGRPHCSVVTAAVVDGELWISTTAPSVKARNASRDGRVTFSAGVRPWAAIEGDAVVDDGDGILERLRTYYRTAAGEHPDWDDYDEAMRRESRVLVRITPRRAYGFGI